MATLYVVICLGGPYAEGYCVANDFEQAQGRVFQQIARIIEASPLLRGSAKITANRIEFPSTGATIAAIASDYAGAAGANPTITVFDELWAYTSERARRLWDEMVPVPTRKLSVRLTVTYAGFEGESALLEELYKRGVAGEQIAPSLYRRGRLLMFWSHEPVAPWQTQAWLDAMRETQRLNAYLRMIENRWVTSESNFVEMEWWDACVDQTIEAVDRRPFAPGMDRPRRFLEARQHRNRGSHIRPGDEPGQTRLAPRLPTITRGPAQFRGDGRKHVTRAATGALTYARFDMTPDQLQAVAQRLSARGLRMVEFAQSVPNLTEASSNLYELIKGRNLAIYPDARCVLPSPGAWRSRRAAAGGSRRRRSRTRSTWWWRWRWPRWALCRADRDAMAGWTLFVRTPRAWSARQVFREMGCARIRVAADPCLLMELFSKAEGCSSARFSALGDREVFVGRVACHFRRIGAGWTAGRRCSGRAVKQSPEFVWGPRCPAGASCYKK